MVKTCFLVISALVISACSSGTFGKRVNEPFSGSRYESNNRYFRGTGKGESSADNIARGKADIEAKAMLASQINSTIKQVSDQYVGQRSNEKGADVSDKFESLIREVMNTNLADLRKVGEQKYKKGNKYTVFIAYEVKKNAMFRFMKKQASVNQQIDERQKEIIQKILDEELKKADEADKD